MLLPALHASGERFYGTIGFKQVPANELPEHLRTRMAHYSGRGLSIIGMKRRAFLGRTPAAAERR